MSGNFLDIHILLDNLYNNSMSNIEDLNNDIEDVTHSQLDPKSPAEIILAHAELIKNNWELIPGIREEPKGPENLMTYQFHGYIYNESGEGLFPSGVDMSLWDIQEKLVLIANSGQNITMLGSIRKSGLKTDDFNFKILEGNRLAPPYITISRSRSSQESLEDILYNWAKLSDPETGNIKKAEQEYLRLIRYAVDGRGQSLFIWEKRKNKALKNPLFYLTFQAMHWYLMNCYIDEPNKELIGWLDKNTAISPRVKPEE